MLGGVVRSDNAIMGNGVRSGEVEWCEEGGGMGPSARVRILNRRVTERESSG